ncbi:MAG: hypothetical protein OI74_12630 [Gammaproteobacteria bacterium (ex Lamellibrachia satsuma)]|nr:MAG: hypothetical protein OI74_12630 [Gammaproteobacteria bacterium (ex Lamellibrachia satsuma)]RRS35392.1 MAG: hypothetical protein NV67_10655 [Gammaproteobacteria bacterium (ex Lamellibrachia satsuma)]
MILALALLVAAFFADDPHDTFATNDLAITADLFYRCTYFHEPVSKIPLVQAGKIKLHMPGGANLPI